MKGHKIKIYSINKMDLSANTRRLLEREHIYTNYTLSQKTSKEIKAIVGLSESQFSEIEFALFKTGCFFSDKRSTDCYSNDVLENLPLSYATIVSLKNAGFKSIKQLQQYSTEQLKKFFKLDPKSCNEIIRKLNGTKYHLSNQAPESFKDMSILSLLNSSVDILPLSSRSANALKKNGIKKIKQLSRLSSEEIQQLHGIGLTSFYDIHRVLTAIGYTCKNDKYILETELPEECDLSTYGHTENDSDLFEDLDWLLELDNEYIDDDSF